MATEATENGEVRSKNQKPEKATEAHGITRKYSIFFHGVRHAHWSCSPPTFYLITLFYLFFSGIHGFRGFRGHS
jgi:hypothetical protein